MADRDDRYPKNVPGKYFTDTQCADCDACRQTAPGIFERDDEGGYSYVVRQPETPEE
jgi:ferredoxin